MEALLSLSFDNLSSYDASKIRKGMRQVEGLLAQICLSKHKPSKRHSLLVPADNPPPSPRKELADLPDDPAFREFFKLQDGFEWNVALRLVNCLDRLLGKSNDGQNDLLILACLDLIQGILLLHPSSRSLFSRELYMNVRHPSHPVSHTTLTNSPPTAPSRPPRTHKLPSDPICNTPHPRRGPPRHPSQHAHLRSARRPPHRHLALQIALHPTRRQDKARRVPILLPPPRVAQHSLRGRPRLRARHAPAQSE